MKQAIVIDNLSKCYQLGNALARDQTIPEAISNRLKGDWNRFRGRLSKGNDSRSGEFWALRNVSFEVHPGEVIGIIGRNGAGKSTLLKILSQIVEPTEGKALIRGRLGSLLEVGTGFHPELSGRENIYLNGSILGMSRAEITRKFDEIVAFSDIEAFLDTPVKRYSSGMYVRLAFAIAANLQPEILVLDEVLAVGDAQFQKKCLWRRWQCLPRWPNCVVCQSRHLCDSPAVRPIDSHGERASRRRRQHRGRGGTIISMPGPRWDFPQHPSTCYLPRDWFRQCDVRGSDVYGENSSDNPTLYSGGPFNAVLTIRSEFRQMVDSILVVLQDRSGTELVNADTMRLGKPVELQPGINRVRIRISPSAAQSRVFTFWHFGWPAGRSQSSIRSKTSAKWRLSRPATTIV